MSISWHPFESAKIFEITFRALLTESGARVFFHRDGFNRPAKTLA
jgi:hypothetical protein